MHKITEVPYDYTGKLKKVTEFAAWFAHFAAITQTVQAANAKEDCEIKACCTEKGLNYCFECDEYPCANDMHKSMRLKAPIRLL